MSAYVALKGVTKVYQMGEVSIKACDGVDFEIEEGEFAIIVGPVSYTHLDVYKRQAQSRAISPWKARIISRQRSI